MIVLLSRNSRLPLMDHCTVAVVKIFYTQYTRTQCIMNALIASKTKYIPDSLQLSCKTVLL